jgi:dihydrofolate synthase / folylpolyglutamate synthase
MNYQEIVNYLFSKRPKEVYDTADVIREVAESLGSPEKCYPTVHVTGTNGKGSVSLKIASALQSSGLKVGLFTSPHLFSFCERIVINGVQIPEETVRQGLLKLFELDYDLCFFDLATLLAFEYFRDQKVDIAVIEAGIGGLFDTTNIIIPLVSVITSVAKDHEDILGKTLEEIAFQKAGIIKPGTPIVIGAQADFKVIRERAAACQSPLYKVESQPGFYDHENSAIARKALEILRIKEKDIEVGLQTRPPCRFEQIGRAILDVAHNPAGFTRLIEAIDFHYPGKRFSAIVAMSRDKDVRTCLSILAARASHLYLVQSPALKALSVEEMSQILRQEGITHFTADLSIGESVCRALALEELVVGCGSFYIMEELRQEVLRIEIAHDQPALSRC